MKCLWIIKEALRETELQILLTLASWHLWRTPVQDSSLSSGPEDPRSQLWPHSTSPLQFSISITLNISRSQFPSKTKVQICEHHHYTSFKHAWPCILQSFPTRRRWWHPTPVLLVWKIPWMEEPDWLQSMGSLRVRDDWATSLPLFTFIPWRRKWQSTPVFLPGESLGRGSLVGCRLWAQSLTQLKQLSSSSCSSPPYRKCSGN